MTRDTSALGEETSREIQDESSTNAEDWPKLQSKSYVQATVRPASEKNNVQSASCRILFPTDVT